MADRIKQSNWAAASVRIGVGLVFLYHGAQMLFGAFGGGGLTRTGAEIYRQLRFSPEVFWAIALAGAVFLSGLCLTVGLFTRIAAVPAALASAFGLFVPGWNRVIFHADEPIFPYALLLLAASLAIYWLGPGFVSMDRKIARERAEA